MPITSDEFESIYGSQQGGQSVGSGRNFGWGSRFSAGVDTMLANTAGVLEDFGLDTGDYRREKQVEADYTRGRSIEDTGAPTRITDVDGPSSLGKAALGLFADSAPQLGVSLAAGLATRGFGTAARLGAAAAAGAPFNYGDILQNQRDEAGQTDWKSAAPLLVPYIALDMLGADAALATGKFARTGIKRLDGMTGVGGVAARAGVNTGVNAVMEGGSETGQEVVNQLGRMGVNRGQTLFNPEANDRYLESFLGGSLLGGAISAPMGSWMRSKGFRDNERVDLLARQQTEQDQREQTQLLGIQREQNRAAIDERLAPLFPTDETDADANRRRAAYAKQFEDAAGAESGVFVHNPENGYETQLDVGQVLKRRFPDAPQPPAAQPPMLGYDPNVRGASEFGASDVVAFPDGSTLPRSEYQATFGDRPRITPAGPVPQPIHPAVEAALQERQRQEAITAEKQKAQQARQAAVNDLAGVDENGKPAVNLSHVQVEAHRRVTDALKNGWIDRQQYATTMGELQDVVERDDKKQLGSIISEFKKLEQEKLNPKPAPNNAATAQQTPADHLSPSDRATLDAGWANQSASPSAPKVQRAPAPAAPPVVRKAPTAAPIAPKPLAHDFVAANRQGFTRIQQLRAERMKLDESLRAEKDPEKRHALKRQTAAVDSAISSLLPSQSAVRTHINNLMDPNRKGRYDVELRRRLQLLTGHVWSADGLVFDRDPVSQATTAKLESVSESAISKQLRNRGLSDDHIARALATDMASDTDVDAQDENDATSDSASDLVGASKASDTALPVHRKEDSASKAFGEGLMNDEALTPYGASRARKIAEAIASDGFTVEAFKKHLKSITDRLDSVKTDSHRVTPKGANVMNSQDKLYTEEELDADSKERQRLGAIKTEAVRLASIARDKFVADGGVVELEEDVAPTTGAAKKRAEKAAQTKSEAEAAKAEADRQEEIKRQETAKRNADAALIAWATSQDGANAVSDWNFYRTKSKVPAFTGLTQDQQLHWLKTVFELSDGEQNDPRAVQHAQRAVEGAFEQQVLPAGGPESQGDVGGKPEGTGQNTGAVQGGGATVRGTGQVQDLKTQGADRPAGKATLSLKRKEPTAAPAPVAPPAPGPEANLPPEVQAEIDNHLANRDWLEKLLVCLKNHK